MLTRLLSAVSPNMPGTTSALISATLGVLLVCGVVFVVLPNDSHNQPQPTTPTSLSSTNKVASTVLQGPDGTSYTLSFLRNVSVESPGYTMLPANLSGTDAPMLITTFPKPSSIKRLNPGSTDGIIQTITDQIDWPNEVTIMQNSTMFGAEAMIVGAGFLVPGHSNGHVYIIVRGADGSWQQPVSITKVQRGWFYHVALPFDIDGDGDLDLVTSRAYYPTWNFWQKKQGKLVWLENPGEGRNLDEVWTEHEIADGPDFLITLRSETAPFELLAPEYIAGKLVYHYRDSVTGAFRSRVLDDNFGPGFSAEWVDVNGDGHKEILATNHASDGNGKVYAFTYDPNESLATAEVTTHVLASGFKCRGSATKGGKCATGQVSASMLDCVDC